MMNSEAGEAAPPGLSVTGWRANALGCVAGGRPAPRSSSSQVQQRAEIAVPEPRSFSL